MGGDDGDGDDLFSEVGLKCQAGSGLLSLPPSVADRFAHLELLDAIGHRLGLSLGFVELGDLGGVRTQYNIGERP